MSSAVQCELLAEMGHGRELAVRLPKPVGAALCVPGLHPAAASVAAPVGSAEHMVAAQSVAAAVRTMVVAGSAAVEAADAVEAEDRTAVAAASTAESMATAAAAAARKQDEVDTPD